MIEKFRAAPLPVRALIAAALYFLCARLGLILRAQPENVAILWPASGCLLALLLLTNKREWPVFLLTLLPLGGIADMLAGRSWVVGIGYTAIDGVEALMAAALMRRFAGPSITFGRLREVIVLSLLAGIPSCALSAALAALVNVVNGGNAPFASVWLVWFSSALVGIIAITPVIITGMNSLSVWQPPETARVLEAIGVYGILAVSTTLIFRSASHLTTLPLLYLPFPLLIWAALRFNPLGTTLSTLLLVTIAIGYTINGRGPLTLSAWETTTRVQCLQLYLIVTLVSTHMVAAMVEDRKQAESQLRASEKRYRLITDHVRDMISLLSPTGEYLFVSPVCVRRLGYEPADLLGRNATTLIHPEDAARVIEALTTLEAEGRSIICEFRIRCKEGSYLWFETVAEALRDSLTEAPLTLLCVSRDTTERRHMEEQLQQAQKMESVGRLAGGIAHDFNNLLTAILGYAELAQEQVPAESETAQALRYIQLAGERAAGLTGQLLAFARKQVVAPQAVDISDLVREGQGILRRLIEANIAIETALMSDLWKVKIDPGQFHQILLNLALNARDAMPSGGRLLIETDNIVLDTEYTQQHTNVQPGEYILLAVSDTGVGMSAEIQTHVFEPFFTTKPSGKGTGMGLATCYGIIQQNQGHIHVYSEENKGTTFKVYLPRVTETGSSPLPSLEALRPTHGTETLLVAEDNELVRDFCVQTLRHQGYNVLVARQGSEALECSKNYKGDIHLLITDVIMPQMSVEELTRQFLEERPETRILYMSGYTENAALAQNLFHPEANFLQKPFTSAALLHKVRQMLT